MRFEVGDKLQAKQDIGYVMGQTPEDKIEENEVVTVEKVFSLRDKKIVNVTKTDMAAVYLEEHANRYGPFPLDLFRRVGPPMCPKCGSTELDELGSGPDGDGYGCPECKVSILLQHYDPEM